MHANVKTHITDLCLQLHEKRALVNLQSGLRYVLAARKKDKGMKGEGKRNKERAHIIQLQLFWRETGRGRGRRGLVERVVVS